jgi:hypothetical protein
LTITLTKVVMETSSLRTGRQLIQACQLTISLEVWKDEFRSMLEFVHKWSKAKPVRSCFCIPRGAKLMLFFVPKTESFDFDLADELTTLNGKIHTDFGVGTVETRQIPWNEIERFLDVGMAKLVYGELPKSSDPMAP